MAPLPSFHDQPTLLRRLRQIPGGPEALPVLVRSLYRERVGWDRALARVPQAVADTLGAEFAWCSARVTGREDNPDGTTSKALWRAHDGAVWESVLIRHPRGRSTLCVSSQAGCALGCAFCATGKLGLVRDLGTQEILDQAVWASETLAPEGRTLTNVVFMGMGEPLLNLPTVGAALGVLTDQRLFEVAPRRICVSTCGVTPEIEPFYRAFPKVKLALSLHAARQDLRDRLMPGCRTWPLEGLLKALDGYSAFTGHKLFLEYVMIAGVNDGPRESAELAALAGPRGAHVNLIPYNPSPRDPWGPSDRSVLDRFQDELGRAGAVSTVRHSAGESIAAACGRLAGGTG